MLHAPLLARRQELLDLERSLDAQIACKEQERQQLLVAIREEVGGGKRSPRYAAFAQAAKGSCARSPGWNVEITVAICS